MALRCCLLALILMFSFSLRGQQEIEQIRSDLKQRVIYCSAEEWAAARELEGEGLRVVTPLRQELAPRDESSLQLSVSFEVEDQAHQRRPAALEKVIYWNKYEPVGTYRLQQEEELLRFVESGVSYTLHFPTAMEAERVKEMLCELKQLAHAKDSQKKEQQTPSAIFRGAGYTHVVHGTRPENLEAIVKTGGLQPGRLANIEVFGDPIGNHDGVFLSVARVEEGYNEVLHFVSNRLPLLLFNMEKVADQHPFHISAGYPYGRFIKIRSEELNLFPSAFSSDPSALYQFAHTPYNRKGNELVVKERVSLNSLEKILVRRGKKRYWIERLGREWEDRIEEVDPLFVELFSKEKRPNLLEPYSENSDAIVVAHLHQRRLAPQELIELLYREYPQLMGYYQTHWADVLAAVELADDGGDGNRARLTAALSLPGEEPELLLHWFGYCN